MVEEELLRAAFHEAGHAVFCWLAGYRIEYVSVSADERPYYPDRCQHDYPTKPKSADIFAHLLISLAGPYAEHRATHGKPMMHQSYEDFLVRVAEDAKNYKARDEEEIPTDLMNACASIKLALSKGGGRDIEEQLYMEACKHTGALVEEYWPEIQAVAEKLEEACYLEAEEVACIIQGVAERSPAV